MDHVMSNSGSSSRPNTMASENQYGYSNVLQNIPVDPSLVDQNFSQVFHPQQQFLEHQPAFQQYPNHSQAAYGYGILQQPVYANTPYTSIYEQQNQPVNGVSSYRVPQYEVPDHTPVSQQLQHSFSGNPIHPYYSPHPSGGIGISPQSLDRSGSVQAPLRAVQPQRPIVANNSLPDFQQNWNRQSAYHPEQTTDFGTPYHQLQPAAPSSQFDYTPTDTNTPAPSQNIVPLTLGARPSTTIQPTTSSRLQTSFSRSLQTPLTVRPRITHQDLLSTFENNPSHKIKFAPFLVLTSDIEIDLQAKNYTNPTFKARSNRSKKFVFPGFEARVVENLRFAESARDDSVNKVRKRPKTLKPTKKLPTKNVIPQGTVSVNRSAGASPRDDTTSEEDETSSEEESEYSDDEVLDEGPGLEEMRDKDRPSDPVGGVVWDVLGIIYTPPLRLPLREELMKATADFQVLISTLREDIKKTNTDLAAAEKEKRGPAVDKLTRTRTLQQKVLLSALQTALQHGHAETLSLLGSNQRTVSNLTGILIECLKAEDYTGDLPKAVFALLAKFKTVSEELLTKCKFEAIKKRFAKRGDDQIKEDIKTILLNTPEGKARAEKEKKNEPTAASAPEAKARALKAEETSKAALPSNNLKRPHEPDAATSKPNKKIASENSTTPTSKIVATKTVTAKPSSFFANLGKQSAKPATSGAKLLAAKSIVKKPAVSADSPQKSSLAAILASIEQPKEAPKTAKEPERLNETPAEKAKRERKESRRHLRVRFREGESLTDIKLFQHELAEDEGRQENMLRDAHDDRSEGLRLKQRLSAGMEDEEDISGEIDVRPYPQELSEIDFSVLSEGVLERNFTTRGGNAIFRTRQQEIQERREDRELMVVYTDEKDIPWTPKEPPYEPPGVDQETPLGFPVENQYLTIRLQQIHQYGPGFPIYAKVHQLEKTTPAQSNHHTPIMSPQETAARNAMAPKPDITTVLRNLAAMHPSKQHAQRLAEQGVAPSNGPPITFNHVSINPSAPQMDAAALANLVNIANALKGKPFPAVEPPSWMNQAQKTEWWEGYHRDAAEEAKTKLERQNKAAEEAKMKQLQDMIAAMAQQPAQAQAQMAYPAYAVPSVTPQASYDPANLQKVLEGLQSTAQQQQNPAMLQQVLQSLQSGAQQQPPMQQPQQQPDLAAWAAALAANPNAFQAQPQQAYDYTQMAAQMYGQAYAPPTTQAQTYGSIYTPAQQSWQQANWNGQGQNAESSKSSENTAPKKHWQRDSDYQSRPHDDNYKRGTKPCRFWAEGKCAKGASCTYIHE